MPVVNKTLVFSFLKNVATTTLKVNPDDYAGIFASPDLSKFEFDLDLPAGATASNFADALYNGISTSLSLDFSVCRLGSLVDCDQDADTSDFSSMCTKIADNSEMTCDFVVGVEVNVDSGQEFPFLSTTDAFDFQFAGLLEPEIDIQGPTKILGFSINKPKVCSRIGLPRNVDYRVYNLFIMLLTLNHCFSFASSHP